MNNNIEIQVRHKRFIIPSSLVAKSSYLSTNYGVIDRSAMIFKHVLEYLYDQTYPYPIEHLDELQYYGIDYPKYSVERADMVTIINYGAFRANILMAGSTYLHQELSKLYVGESLNIECSSKAVKHILRRILDAHYVIPYEHIDEAKFFGVQKLTLTDKTMMKINVSGVIFEVEANILCKIPLFEKQIEEDGAVKPIMNVYYSADSPKGLVDVINYVTGNYYPNYKYVRLYSYLGLYPTNFVNVAYEKCRQCMSIVKKYISSNGDWNWGYSAYCRLHRCYLCNRSRSGSQIIAKNTNAKIVLKKYY